MSSEPLFIGEDLRLIESLAYNSDLKPSYDHLKNCLVWEDERAEGLSPIGYENLCDLWIARSFIHRGMSFSEHRLDPNYFQTVWERALGQKLKWPGFARLTLCEEDKNYYEKMRMEADEI